ncbi:MAG TPA: DUF554 domain-containing protein [Clostridiaceae bacterium]|jgi:uncharacterized membrane protein YqgA involved in biofilm formation|nr:DUF554 domain-containing protein [Clostridiaceae bacterium]
MIGLGTLINTCAIIAGGIIGIFLKKGLPERYKNTIIQTVGLAVMIVGISGALQSMYIVVEEGHLSREYIMLMVLSLVIGGIVGEFLNIEEYLNKMGMWFKQKLSFNDSNFSQGFVGASLLFCVGAMAIVGSLEDGLAGNPGTLIAKSILDGVTAMVFASTLGVGVVFSSIPVLVYQGGITLLAGFLKPWLTDVVISQMSLVGSVLIMAIGINMLEIKKLKTGNMLPAIFIPLIYYMLSHLIR